MFGIFRGSGAVAEEFRGRIFVLETVPA